MGKRGTRAKHHRRMANAGTLSDDGLETLELLLEIAVAADLVRQCELLSNTWGAGWLHLRSCSVVSTRGAGRELCVRKQSERNHDTHIRATLWNLEGSSLLYSTPHHSTLLHSTLLFSD